MASSEQKQHLETLLSETFGSAFESARRSLAGELQRHTEARERGARSEAFGVLRDACRHLDTCTGQTELLTALLEEAGRFASRTALWITSEEGPRGWASYGFDEEDPAIASLRASWDDHPWQALSRGSGCVEIEGEEAVDLSGTLSTETAETVVLIPLVLRDRIAAALYADRRAGAETDVEALQLLAFTASLLLEIQGLRERERTPTLHPDSASGPALALWDQEAARAEAAEPVAEEEAAEVEAPEEEPAEPEAIPEAAEEDLWAEAEALREAEAEPIPPTGVEPPDERYEATELDEFDVEELPEVAPEEVPPSDEVTTEIPSQKVESEATVRISQEMISEAQEQGLAPPPLDEEAEEAEVEELAEEEAEVEEAIDEQDTSEDRTMLLDRPTLTEEPAAGPVEPPPEPRPVPPPTPGSTEVAPPTDLEGPGLAFRDKTEARAEPGELDEEATAIREEARRLARLLVSEIKLYNEEEVEAGRRNNDIYQRLREDIDRSRQMYRDRVDPRVRDDVDYFQQELVNILAGGDSDALGL